MEPKHTILSNQKSTHLFCLVGTNPLPIFVTANLLGFHEGALFLIAAPGVVNVAEQIRKQLPNFAVVEIITLSNPYDDHLIKQKIRAYLRDLAIDSTSSIGLHYTGGTKPMSLHIHEVFKEWCNRRRLSYSLSYLDPTNLALRFLNGLVYPIEIGEVQLSFDQMVQLHGWAITSYSDKPELPDLIPVLAAKIGDKNTLETWRQWCDRYLRTWRGRNPWLKDEWPAFKESGIAADLVAWVDKERGHSADLASLLQWLSTANRKQRKRELADIQLPQLLQDATQCMRIAELRASIETETGWTDNNKGYDKLSAFLDGGWLESYVLQCVQNLAMHEGIHDARSSVFIERRGAKDADFEFDVIAMKGYQLFALSCTTSNSRGMNKHKLLESYTRARQIGGDEARVALVGGYHDSAGLLREIDEEWFAPRDMIRVFGVDDWPNLQEELYAWFNWQAI